MSFIMFIELFFLLWMPEMANDWLDKIILFYLFLITRITGLTMSLSL